MLLGSISKNLLEAALPPVVNPLSLLVSALKGIPSTTNSEVYCPTKPALSSVIGVPQVEPVDQDVISDTPQIAISLPSFKVPAREPAS